MITKKKQAMSEFLQQFEEFIIKDCEGDEIALQGNVEHMKNLLHLQHIIGTISDKMFNKCEPTDEEALQYLEEIAEFQ